MTIIISSTSAGLRAVLVRLTLSLMLLVNFNISTFAADDEAGVAAEASKQPHVLRFVIAKHVSLYEGRIVTVEEIEKILEAAATKYGKIRPEFFTTGGGRVREQEFEERRGKLYKRLYDSKHLDGMSLGSLSPRSSLRFDRIHDAADLLPVEADKRIARVVDSNDKPVGDVEVSLLPAGDNVDVYLQNGRNRNPLEEHLVRTDETGKFVVYPDADEVFIVAVHPSGFFMTTLDNLKAGQAMKLLPWARMHGNRPTEGDDAKQSIHFTCHPIARSASFHIYETEIADDGSFDQRFLPPGKTFVQRSLQAGNGLSLSFPVSEWILNPGESEQIELGPIPVYQKQQMDARRNK